MDVQSPPPEPQISRKSGSITGGVVLIAIGILFLLDKFIPEFSFGDFWPLILIAIGVGIIWNARRGA